MRSSSPLVYSIGTVVQTRSAWGHERNNLRTSNNVRARFSGEEVLHVNGNCSETGAAVGERAKGAT